MKKIIWPKYYVNLNLQSDYFIPNRGKYWRAPI